MPFSTCVNYFTSTVDEKQLNYGIAMTRHLLCTWNLRISYLDTDILLFDDDAAGVFHHVKIHPEVAAAHVYSVGQTLHIPIGSTFDSNVSPRNWELFAKFRYMLAEHLKSSLDVKLFL